MNNSVKHPEGTHPADLAGTTREFEAPHAFERTRPMTPAERAKERALRRRRPSIGQVAKKISLSLEPCVPRDADVLAQKKVVKCSERIARFVVAGLKRTA